MTKAKAASPPKYQIISTTDKQFLGMEIDLEGLIAGIEDQPFTPTAIIEIDENHIRLSNSNYTIEARKV